MNNLLNELEIWKSLDSSIFPIHFNHYKVANTGRIIGPKNTILKPSKRGNYLGLCLSTNKIRKSIDIHRLVAQHFVPNPLNLPQVNHEDGNTLNNNDWNLKWTTPKGNMEHAIKNGLRNDFGSNSKNSKLTEEDVIYIRNSYPIISKRELAKKYGVNKDYLWLVINKKRWKHI